MEISKELNSVLKALTKKFGREIHSIGPKYEPAQGLSTGCAEFDAATCIGGIPEGRITEIYGPASSGKTSLSLYLARQYKEKHKENARLIAIIDIERSTDIGLLNSMGLNAKEILFQYPDTAEEALETWLELVRSNAVGFIVFDSIDGIQTAKQLGNDIDKADMQGTAKLLSRCMREGSKLCVQNSVTTVFINQIRDSLDMFRPGPTTPGGKALSFYATQRIMTREQKPSKNLENAFEMGLKLIKNKCGPPSSRDWMLVDFLYGKGPDLIISLFTIAKARVIATRAKQTVLIGAENEIISKEGGGEGGIRVLRESPELVTRISEIVANKIKNKAEANPEETETETELGD